MNFAFVYIYRHIYRKWESLVDSKCRNTVILTGLTYTTSRKVFRDGCPTKEIFPQQILNKNSLSLAHCALNRSFTVRTYRNINIIICSMTKEKLEKTRRFIFSNNIKLFYSNVIKM